jgi:hypothetical protein
MELSRKVSRTQLNMQSGYAAGTIVVDSGSSCDEPDAEKRRSSSGSSGLPKQRRMVLGNVTFNS